MEGFTLLHLVTYSLLWGELAGPPGYLGCVGLYQACIPFPDQVQSAVERHSKYLKVWSLPTFHTISL